MSFYAPPNPELDSLLENLLEDRLTPADAARLNHLLKTDPRAANRYLLYVELHGAMLHGKAAIPLQDNDFRPQMPGDP